MAELLSTSRRKETTYVAKIDEDASMVLSGANLFTYKALTYCVIYCL